MNRKNNINQKAKLAAEPRSEQGLSWKAIWESVEREQQKLLSVDFMEESPWGAIWRNKKEKRYSLELKFKYDKPRLTKLLGKLSDFSEEDRKIYEYAQNALADLSQAAYIRFSAKETKENFLEMLAEMQKFYRYRKRKYAAFQRKVQKVAEIVKKANKVIKKYNSEIVRARRASKEAERKALAESRYEEVRDKMLKDFFEVKNVTVLDKSTKHRAVLFAHLAEYYNYRKWGPFDGWAVDELILAGVDDNEEQWEIHVNVMRDFGGMQNWDYTPLTDFSETTVEKVMAWIWDVKDKYLQKALRQGDILIVPLSDTFETAKGGIYDIIRCMGDVEIGETEKTKNISPSPNHEIVSDNEFNYATVEIKCDDEEREELYIETDHPVTMKHVSHQPVTIPPGRWLVLKQLAKYREQNAD